MTDLLGATGQALQQRHRRLRIGLVCPYSLSVPGGVGNHVLGLAGYLSSVGDQVRILAPGELLPGRAAQHGLRMDQFTSVGRALPIPYNGSVARITFGLRTAARVGHWLAANDLDLLHIHEPLAPSVSLISLLRSTAPVVATFHTATPGSRLLRAAGTVLQSAVDRIDVGIAVSNPARQVVVDHLHRDPRVIPNGIRAGEFGPDAPGPHKQRRSVADQRWRGGDHPRMVFLGRLDEPRKGLSVLLDALPAICRRHPQLEVVIAGQGDTARINRRLPDGCRTVGELDDLARDALLRSADLFVAPHLARESFGIVLIEAIAAGASVIASDLPAFQDLLGGGESGLGYLFGAGNPVALSATVDRALAQDRTELNARARTAVTRYDWSTVGPAIRQVYATLLS